MLLYVLMVVGLVISTLHPVLLGALAMLWIVTLAITVAIPIRWLAPWLLLGAGTLWATYIFRLPAPEDWEGDFILIAGPTPFVLGILVRTIFWLIDRSRPPHAT